MSSSVVTYFEAAYSLNVAIQYPLLTTIVCATLGLLFRHNVLLSIGSAGGAALGGAVANYYEIKPYSQNNILATLVLVIASLYFSSYHHAVTLLLRVVSITMDVWTLQEEEKFIPKLIYLGAALFFHILLQLLFVSQMNDEIRVMKLDMLLFLGYSGFMVLVLDYLKRRKKV